VRVKKSPPMDRHRGLPHTPWLDKQAKALPKVKAVTSDSAIMEKEDEDFNWRVDVDEVKHLYEKWIIPLTKEVEIEYLLHRLDGMTPEQIEALQHKERNGRNVGLLV